MEGDIGIFILLVLVLMFSSDSTKNSILKVLECINVQYTLLNNAKMCIIMVTSICSITYKKLQEVSTMEHSRFLQLRLWDTHEIIL